MKPTVKVINTRTGSTLADNCQVADTLVTRTVGLLNRSELSSGEGLLIRPCSSVHCFFMRFAIDVVFLDTDNRVLRIYPSLRPWRFTRWVRRAKSTLELPAGVVEASDTRVGDKLRIE